MTGDQAGCLTFLLCPSHRPRSATIELGLDRGRGSAVPAPPSKTTRLDPTFARLTQAFDAQRVSAQDDAAAHEPDLVLVLEIAGELDEFVRRYRRVPGLEFLTEQIEDEVEPDEFVAVDFKGKEHGYRRQLFLVASDRSAWEEMLRLWGRYKRGDSFPHGFAPFRNLFERLRELRQWEDRDRLELAGAAEVWERELGGRSATSWSISRRSCGGEPMLRGGHGEYRGATRGRREAEERSSATFEHEGIAYHGVLGTAPASLLVEAAQHREVRWLRTRVSGCSIRWDSLRRQLQGKSRKARRQSKNCLHLQR